MIRVSQIARTGLLTSVLLFLSCSDSPQIGETIRSVFETPDEGATALENGTTAGLVGSNAADAVNAIGGLGTSTLLGASAVQPPTPPANIDTIDLEEDENFAEEGFQKIAAMNKKRAKGLSLRKAIARAKARQARYSTLILSEQTEILECDDGGTVTIKFTFDGETGAGSSTTTFDNCKEFGSESNGVIHTEGKFFSDPDTQQQVGVFRMEMGKEGEPFVETEFADDQYSEKAEVFSVLLRMEGRSTSTPYVLSCDPTACATTTGSGTASSLPCSSTDPCDGGTPPPCDTMVDPECSEPVPPDDLIIQSFGNLESTFTVNGTASFEDVIENKKLDIELNDFKDKASVELNKENRFISRNTLNGGLRISEVSSGSQESQGYDIRFQDFTETTSFPLFVDFLYNTDTAGGSVALPESEAFQTISFEGTIQLGFDPDKEDCEEGTFAFQTITPLKVPIGAHCPIEGEIHINNAATIVFNNDASVDVAVGGETTHFNDCNALSENCQLPDLGAGEIGLFKQRFKGRG